MGRKHAETTGDNVGTAGCLYDMAGNLCGKPVRARGYCTHHYKVLYRHGAFKPASTSLQPGTAVTEGQVTRNLGHLDKARAYLEERAYELAECLVGAAKVAAAKGNSEPAQWALLHTRTLAPVLTGGGASGKGSDSPGIRVLVGVQLGTAPTNPPTSQQPAIGQNAGTLDRSSSTLPIVTAEVIPA